MRLLTLFCALACASAEYRLTVAGYSVLYDPAPHGLRANFGTAMIDGKRVCAVFTGGLDDDEAGTLAYEACSADGGRTFGKPRWFEERAVRSLVRSPADEYLTVFLSDRIPGKTLFAAGYHVPRAARKESYHEDLRYRPSAALIARRPNGAAHFELKEFPAGTFLGEQFAAPGLQMRDGRVLVTLWGARAQGENWQCGVLISDDDGRTFHYRTSGYEAELGIRDDPKTPAGYNEQTLFETADGGIVSLIRGREKLGRLQDSPKDTWYFRSESRDRGENWSQPAPVNLAGTGAPSTGVTLPDGSLLMMSRLPYARQLYKLEDPAAYGLHFARSTDSGKTWRTERIVQKDPEGRPFENYYNAMNGVFLKTGPEEWTYVFGQFSTARNIHRLLAIRFRGGNHASN